LLLVCAFYRARFDEWPSIVEVHLGIRENLQWVLGDDAFDCLASRLELRVNPQIAYFRASGAGGSPNLDYQGAEGVKVALHEQAGVWLTEKPARRLVVRA
jgi:hypothetical protein